MVSRTRRTRVRRLLVGVQMAFLVFLPAAAPARVVAARSRRAGYRLSPKSVLAVLGIQCVFGAHVFPRRVSGANLVHCPRALCEQRRHLGILRTGELGKGL